MKKYKVDCSEVIFYTLEVEAKNSEDVREQILSGNIIMPEPNDSKNFEINNIELIR
jgi:hypothetical protein